MSGKYTGKDAGKARAKMPDKVVRQNCQEKMPGKKQNAGVLRRQKERAYMAMEKKKQKTAIALEYNPEEEAPKIIATGRGRVAEKIIETAKEADVPIHEDSKLADTLSKLEIGEMIPPELYEVVAEILVFVDAMDKIKAKMEKSGKPIS